MVPRWAAHNSCPLSCQEIVQTVEAVEDEGSGLWVMAKEEGEGLAVQTVAGKAMQQAGPLSCLPVGRPCRDTEDEVVHHIEDGLRNVVRAGGLRAKVIGDVLGACLSELVLVFVDNDGRFHVHCSMVNGQCSTFNVDNTGEAFVAPWLEAVKEIQPQQVMVYTIDRETPAHGLLKATHEQLDAIRDRVIALGIPCTASY